jgi:hypothetical protein
LDQRLLAVWAWSLRVLRTLLRDPTGAESVPPHVDDPVMRSTGLTWRRSTAPGSDPLAGRTGA